MGELRSKVANQPEFDTHTRFSEEAALLDRILAFDGLQATQFVRKWVRTGGGVYPTVAWDFVDKLELHADANGSDSVQTARLHNFGLQGPLRYVANPCVQKAQYPGLFVGGPLRYDIDQRNNVETVYQTLTRLHSVGEWSVSGTDVTVSSTGDAVDALKKCRPVYVQGTKDDAPYEETWPSTGTVQVVFKHWTHESKEPLLALTNEEICNVLAFHAPERRDWKITERRFEIDDETNGGVFTVLCVAKVVYEPESAEDLANQPHKIAPAEKIRVRPFGLASDDANEADGEGAYYHIVCTWWDIAPDHEQYVRWPDNVELTSALIVPKFPDAETVVSNRRHWTVDENGNRRPWYRIVDAKVSHQDDGLLGLEVTWEMPEVSNEDKDVLVEKYGGAGWGIRDTQRYPTVPSERAEAVSSAIPTPSGTVPVSKNIEERQQGYTDIDARFSKVWKYTQDDSPLNMPTYRGFTAPDIEYRPGVCTGGGGMVLTFYRVARDGLDALINRYEEAIVRDSPVDGARLDSVHIREDEDGSLEVRISTTTRKFSAQFGSVLGSDYFTNTYRIEYDGLNISAAGGVTDEHGNPVVIKDALGNPVNVTPGLGSSTTFIPGTVINATYQRDAECKYHVVVTTEVAVARSWEYSYSTFRNGHPMTIKRKEYRNWVDQPPVPNVSHGNGEDSLSYQFSINRFGRYDGSVEQLPDLHEERSVRKSGDAHSYVETVGVRHSSSEPSRAAGLNGHTLVSTDDSTASDGLHDYTVSVETPKTSTHTERWTEKRGGHSIDVEQQTFRNAESSPSVSASGNQAADANVSVNKFDLVDAVVRKQTDVYVKTGDSHVEDAFAITDSDTVRVDPGIEPDVAFTPGRIVTTQNSNYTDNLTDREKRVVVAKPDFWSWTWRHVYRKGNRATAYGYGFRNQTSVPVVDFPSDGDNYTYDQDVNVSKNEFGLFDGSIVFRPVYDGGGKDKSMFYATTQHSYREYVNDSASGLRPVITTITKSYHTSHKGAENAVEGGGPGSSISDPFNSLLGKTMWRAVKVERVEA